MLPSKFNTSKSTLMSHTFWPLMMHKLSKSNAFERLMDFSKIRLTITSSLELRSFSNLGDAIDDTSLLIWNKPSLGLSSYGFTISHETLTAILVEPHSTSTYPFSSKKATSGVRMASSSRPSKRMPFLSASSTKLCSLSDTSFVFIVSAKNFRLQLTSVAMYRSIARASSLVQPRVARVAVRSVSSNVSTLNFFQKERLPTNTIIRFVPQQTAWIVERMGKFHRILPPGVAFLLPVLDKITYVQSLKELAIEIPSQNAITADNVSLELDGILYIKVIDPFKASYGVEDFKFAISQMAQTTMRSEIGSMTLDSVLKERQLLNTNINRAINEAANDHWGVQCLRYEIRDIHPPSNVLEAMHRQVSAERSKRAEILESEGIRQSKINIAEGEKQSQILRSEALKQEKINNSIGEAEAIVYKSEALAKSLEKIAKAIEDNKASEKAINLTVAQDYVKEFGKLAKETNTLILPSNMSDMTNWMASGMKIYESMSSSTKPASSEAAPKTEASTPKK